MIFLFQRIPTVRLKSFFTSLGVGIAALSVILAFFWFRQSHAQGACTVTVTSLPVTLSQSGAVYCLDRDLTNVTSGFSITADNVTFDGQGHSIAFVPDGSGNMPNVFSIDFHDYVTMKNFSFTGSGRVVAKTIQFQDAHHNMVDSVTGVLTNGSNQVGDSLTFMVFFESYGNTIQNSTFMVQYAPDGPATNAGRILYLRNDSGYNTFENNTFVSIDHGSSYAIEMGTGSWGVVHQNMFRNNKIYANQSTTIYMQSGGDHNLYERNLIYSATQNAMNTGGATSGTTNEYYNNTFVAPNGKALVSQTNSANPTQIFKNNIMVSGNNYVIDSHTSTLTSDYNDLYRTSGSGLIWFDGTSYASFAAWQATGRDTHSVNVSPSFVNSTVNLSSYPPSLGDFHLNVSGNTSLLGTGENGVDMGAFPRARSCTENWSCDSFSTCETASQGQYRVCHDSNYCGTTASRPALAQSCSGSCIESWSCGAWSSCSSSTQTRTCADANSCGTTVNRPALSQSCDSTAPTVSITAPTNGATISGTISVTANASDNVGVSGVQFKLDGANLSSEDTSSPYSISWNTVSASNGTHTVTAIARDAAGNSTTSSSISVTVNNAVVCVEDWVTIGCTAWSACTNNVQTRTCTDANSCGTTTNEPPLTQSCTPLDTTAPASVNDLRPIG